MWRWAWHFWGFRVFDESTIYGFIYLWVILITSGSSTQQPDYQVSENTVRNKNATDPNKVTIQHVNYAVNHKKVELFCFCNNFVKYKRNLITFGMFLA